MRRRRGKELVIDPQGWEELLRVDACVLNIPDGKWALFWQQSSGQGDRAGAGKEPGAAGKMADVWVTWKRMPRAESSLQTWGLSPAALSSLGQKAHPQGDR